MDYEALACHVRERLPKDDFVLVGESFSGPLALMIASERPPGLKGLVLVASFARLDLPAKSLLSLAASIVPPGAIPVFALSFLLLGRWKTPRLVAAMQSAIKKVNPSVLSGRAREALAVDLIARRTNVECPTLLLAARFDRLIPRSAATAIRQICMNLRIAAIDGPHFLLQVHPGACAAAIQDFCDDVVLRRD